MHFELDDVVGQCLFYLTSLELQLLWSVQGGGFLHQLLNDFQLFNVFFFVFLS